MPRRGAEKKMDELLARMEAANFTHVIMETPALLPLAQGGHHLQAQLPCWQQLVSCPLLPGAFPLLLIIMEEVNTAPPKKRKKVKMIVLQ